MHARTHARCRHAAAPTTNSLSLPLVGWRHIPPLLLAAVEVRCASSVRGHAREDVSPEAHVAVAAGALRGR